MPKIKLSIYIQSDGELKNKRNPFHPSWFVNNAMESKAKKLNMAYDEITFFFLI